ncbi:MAG: peptidase M75 [Tannerella sp.]|jgi:predicted lipoprotein|nr:peptidase M75 [Tannerella sp.]
MRKYVRFPLLFVTAVALGLSMSSCGDDDDPVTEDTLDPQKTKTIEQYVNGVVIATYKSLADESIDLYEACVRLKDDPGQGNIEAVCNEWIAARKYWEQSEAFLYGAAADYSIDPHIDSWPLDKAQLDQTLRNTTLINNMKENGCNFDGFATLGYGLLGFHAVEYMVFRDGGARKYAGGVDKDGVSYGALSETELVYCAAVAEDLRNQCIRLEASWAGVENISDEKLSILEDAELEPTLNYGEIIIAAGEAGNKIYKTQIAAYVQILQGAADIADEVGNTKITDPVSSGNVLDVESWYSWNSIADFADNIRSVQHAYYGNNGTAANASSVSAYIKSLNPTLDSEIQAAITTAIAEIEAMPAPFRDNLTEAASGKAKDACNALLDKLDEAIELIQE